MGTSFLPEAPSKSSGQGQGPDVSLVEDAAAVVGAVEVLGAAVSFRVTGPVVADPAEEAEEEAVESVVVVDAGVAVAVADTTVEPVMLLGCGGVPPFLVADPVAVVAEVPSVVEVAVVVVADVAVAAGTRVAWPAVRSAPAGAAAQVPTTGSSAPRIPMW